MNNDFEIASIINDDRTMDSYIKGDAFEALTQIIYNSLDASASHIDVNIKYNNLNFIEIIQVLDNGCGIQAPDINNKWDPFLRRGYSEKKIGQINKFNRNLHGKNGDGRFKSYALGSVIEWKSKTTDNSTIIVGRDTNPQAFEIKNGETLTEIATETGTLFTAYVNGKNINLPSFENLKADLERHFLTVIGESVNNKNAVSIYLNNKKLSVHEHIENQSENELNSPYNDVKVKTIIWKQNSSDNNKLFWCDQSYNILKEERLDLSVQKTDNSLYISSQRIEKAKKNNTLEIIQDSKEFTDIKKQAEQIREKVLLEYKKLKTGDIIKRLKDENIYPYDEQNLSSTDKITQPLYDSIIIKINEKKPAFLRGEKSKRYIVKTIKILIEEEPEHFIKILESLLDLTSEETIEFSKILEENPLPAIIKTTKTVSNRVKFLEGLRYLVYGELSKTIKERTQLHKILEKEPWIFGEQFQLSFSDQSFNTIVNDIRAQIDGLSQEEEFDGQHRIPDLFFTKKQYYGQTPGALIVELKRPKVIIGKKELQQIKDYYDIIKSQAEFNNWKIDLIIVSKDIEANIIEGEISNTETGQLKYSEHNNLKKIYVKRWGDILDSNGYALSMLKQSLDINLSSEAGAEYVRDKYSSILSNDMGKQSSS